MQHFIVPTKLKNGPLIIMDKELLHQLKSVLRFRPGDACLLMDGQGGKAEAILKSFHSKEAVFEISSMENSETPKRSLRLYCALSKKPSTFELIIQKATEIGATNLIPLVTERCQVRELRKTDRLLLIVKEASEQSERAFLPKLHHVQTLSDLLQNPPSGLLLAGDPWTYDKNLKDLNPTPDKDLNLIIGPEGGLTKAELEEIRKAGGVLFLLGENVLRMETAAIAALSLVQFG